MTEQQATSEEQLGIDVEAPPPAASGKKAEREAARDAERVFTIYHRNGGFAVPVVGRARATALVERGTHTAEPPDSAPTRRRSRKD